MDEIIQNIWISSEECARNMSMLSNNNITSIISLGCLPAYPETLTYLSYPYILDEPTEPLFKIINECLSFINEQLQSNGVILVHCVYGQSRSATIILSYLLSQGISLDESILLLKEKHPTISINPGFLSQLHLYANRSQFPAEYSLGLLASQHNNILPYLISQSRLDNNNINNIDDDDISKSYIICKRCRQILCSNDHILSNERNSKQFIDDNIDEFWRTYRPIRSKKKQHNQVDVSQGCYIISPTTWICNQMANTVVSICNGNVVCESENRVLVEDGNKEDEIKCKKLKSDVDNDISNMKLSIDKVNTSLFFGDEKHITTNHILCCHNCKSEIGYWRVNGLPICNDFLMAYCISLSHSATRLITF